MDARDERNDREIGSAAGAGWCSRRQAVSRHTTRGAWPEIFTLVSNIDMVASSRVEWSPWRISVTPVKWVSRNLDATTETLHAARPSLSELCRVERRLLVV
jgi:hypothetical protein